MGRLTRRLGDAELEIMQVIWESGGAVRSTYVQQQLKEQRDWSLPAVATALSRLVEKGFLSCETEGRGNLYRPLVSAADYQAVEGRSLLHRLYGDSFTGMVAALYRGKAISRADLAELRDFLDELEKEEE